MSKTAKGAPSMIPGAASGEKVIATILWAQKGTCNCPGCECLREIADSMVSSHVKEVKPAG